MTQLPISKYQAFQLFTLFALVSLLFFNPESQAVSKVKQKGVPDNLAVIEGAILDENDVFITLMTPFTVRSIAREDCEITQRDHNGDKEFIAQHRTENADYWYWAHHRARKALILALGRQPQEAVQLIDTVPFAENLVPEYHWIISEDFKKYLQGANNDLAYLYDPRLGVEVFLTNYQVSKLERQYLTTVPRQGDQRGQEIRPTIPMLTISVSELVATPRAGEEGKVGLDAFLKLPGGEVYDSLLPSSKEFQKRKPNYQEKLVIANDTVQTKIIPVSSKDSKALLELAISMDPKYDHFLMIQGSMNASREATTFSDDLKIVVNPNSRLTQFLTLQRKVFAAARKGKE
jgi:hypothetical protein